MTNLLKILFAVFLLTSCEKDASFLTAEIITQEQPVSYRLEIANTQAKQQKGLMYREHLAPDYGMIFLFEPREDIAMWMKNTYIPLDMLFLDEASKIVFIYENATPMSTKVIAPQKKQKIATVIELNAGQVQKHHIQIGQFVKF